MSQIQVVSVENAGGKFDKNGKPFQQILLNYTDGQGVGKQTITSYSKAYKALAAAEPGDLFDITTEVNGKYTNMISATKVGKAEPTAIKAAATAVKSTYETSAERARKQVMIVRQSSLERAEAYLIAHSVGTASYSVADQISVAKEFEAYVFGDEVTSNETPRVE